jgi:hypothetical protein
MQASAAPRQYTLLWLIVSQLLVLASIYPLVYVVGLLFLYTSGTRPTDPWYYLLTAAPCPGIGMLLSIIAWFAYGRRQYRRAAVLAGFACAVPAALLVLILIGLSWAGAV